jgi:hypothetical protein
MKKSCGTDEFKYDILDTLLEPLRMLSVPPPSTTIKNEKIKCFTVVNNCIIEKILNAERKREETNYEKKECIWYATIKENT